MLALLSLLFLVCAQAALTVPLEDAWQELAELSDVLTAEKRYAVNSVGRAKEKLKTGDDKDYNLECSQEPIELGLVIDSSSSILNNDFNTGLAFLSNFLDGYIIGPGKNEVRVAAISFGLGVYASDGFNLTTYKNKEDVKSHVLRIPHRHGTYTDTGEGLKYMREVQMKSTRPWATKMVVVLTDGDSQRGRFTKQQADKTKAANITVFAVGVGSNVKRQELLNIAGGIEEHVFTAKTYSDLDKDVKKNLAQMTCIKVPKTTTTPPPTTTTTPQAEQPCGEEHPTDINFIFSPAALGLDESSTVTSFISQVTSNERVEEGFRYGVHSADCPRDAGFHLNTYSVTEDLRERLDSYDRNNLPALVSQAAREGFSPQHGGRPNAKKVAVIFLGTVKVSIRDLKTSILELQAKGVKVYVSVPKEEMVGAFSSSLPKGVTFLAGGTPQQVARLLGDLCPKSDK